MSGYLEVKYPLKSNLGLNPFKSWRRQWCILRPSATCSGGCLAVYCSEAGAAAGVIDLPAGSLVRRAKSRSKPYAFAVFGTDDRKPRVLLAAQSLVDAQSWMDKIHSLLSGEKFLAKSIHPFPSCSFPGTESLLKDSFSISFISTDLAQNTGLCDNGTLSVMINGIRITKDQQAMFIEWKFIQDVSLATEENDRICLVKIDRDSPHGGGELKLRTPLAEQVCAAARARHGGRGGSGAGGRAVAGADKRSRSDGDLRRAHADADARARAGTDERRTSWYSGPSEVSLDDIDLVMCKEWQRGACGMLSRCSGEGDLAPSASASPSAGPRLRSCTLPPTPTPRAHTATAPAHSARLRQPTDSISDRRSLVSVASVASMASGIYEEIPDLPAHAHDTSNTYCAMTNTNLNPAQPQPAADTSTDTDGSKTWLRSVGVAPAGSVGRLERFDLEEPTYESVAECVFATMPRAPRTPRLHAHAHAHSHPPPLPPRHALGTKMGECWNSRVNKVESGSVARHSSLGSLPRCCSASAAPAPAPATAPATARSLPTPAPAKGNTFNVFRKRLKSDSRITSSMKSDALKENKDIETKKKKFDFPPTRDIFKSFKVNRKMKNLKITTNLTKGETKSCEFLDETEHVSTKRCSKSVECLEDTNEFLDDEADLSIEFNDDAVSALALPQEIVDLILRSRQQINNVRLKASEVECDYMPMSPIVPAAPMEHHYIVMSPKTNLA